MLIHNHASDKHMFNAFLGDFFPSKTLISWIFWEFWPLLAAFGHFFWRVNISGRHHKRSDKKRIIWWWYNSQARQKNHATNQSINLKHLLCHAVKQSETVSLIEQVTLCMERVPEVWPNRPLSTRRYNTLIFFGIPYATLYLFEIFSLV